MDALMYLAQHMKLDISFVVNSLAHQSLPREIGIELDKYDISVVK